MKHSSKLKPILLVGLFIIVVEAIGSLSGILAGDIKSIYNNLQLPPLAHQIICLVLFGQFSMP